MIRCLITGKLHDTPQSRTSANGNAFAVGKIKADDKGGAWIWVSCIAFGSEAERLLMLKAGDAVAIGGRAELSTWEDKDGNHHPGLSLVADEIAALRAKPRPRKNGEQRRPAQVPASAPVPFDDGI